MSAARARITAFVVASLVFGALMAWPGRLLILHSLAERTLREGDAVVTGYVAGRMPLDAAAQRWNALMTRWVEYQLSYQRMRRVDVWVSNDDNDVFWAMDIEWEGRAWASENPRVAELMNRATQLRSKSSWYEQIQLLYRFE
jgi:hypothetical protein